jgi:hypothetical protein
MTTVTKLDGNASFSWCTEDESGATLCLDTLLTSGFLLETSSRFRVVAVSRC